jgi:hypothetical protein
MILDGRCVKSDGSHARGVTRRRVECRSVIEANTLHGS